MEDIVDALSTPEKPLVVLTGPSGIGRSTRLARLGELLAGQGRPVSTLHVTPAGDVLPGKATLADDGLDGGQSVPDEIWTSLGPTASTRPDLAYRAGIAAAATLQRGDPGAVLLIDDAQWIDAGLLPVLEALVPQLAGSSARCVCTFKTSASRTGAVAALRRLRAAGLVHTLRLRPMAPEQVRRSLTETLSAIPEPLLVERLRDLSRGLPAVLTDVLDMLRENDSIQVVDRMAYLVRGSGPAQPAKFNRLLKAIVELGDRHWAAAKATAAFAPLGTAVPSLVADTLDITEPEALDLLEALRQSGFLHQSRAGTSWRFPVPHVAAGLLASSGPFERHRFAARAVTAVWSGDAHCRDATYLTDQVAGAGRLVDSRRALGVLLKQALATKADQADCTMRWLAAATELAGTRPERMMILLTYTSTCHLHGRYEDSLAGARLLLEEFTDQLSADIAQEVRAMAVAALHSTGNRALLDELAQERLHWPGTKELGLVTKAMALGTLDHWGAAAELLAGTEPTWRAGNPTSAMYAESLAGMAELWAGRPQRFEQGLNDRAGWPMRDVPRHLADHVETRVAALLVTGDLERANRLCADEGQDFDQLRPGNRAIAAALSGDFDLLIDLARRSITDRSTAHTFDVSYAGMHHMAVEALVARGKVAVAREFLGAAQDSTPVLGHLLDLAGAQIDRAVGDTNAAMSCIDNALSTARRHGITIGLDLVWSEQADLALESGERDIATTALTRLTELAEEVPYQRALLHAHFVRALVENDHEAAAACLRIARGRAQPFELARVAIKLVKYGIGEPALLSEYYPALSGLDALLYRARTRSLMREHGVAVPGRQQTVSEDERLLALLVGEGLSNRELASVLRTSEKSVQSKLNRLAARTGHRSRIALSAAILDKEFASTG
ncbi:AAA family ATPase [Amycolatopsis sp. cg5]|uniref:ATP-binding protein n=1 Tax=Amycolatopsis sp. cg5 TaxID=3238802 RepID=UPI003523DB99